MNQDDLWLTKPRSPDEMKLVRYNSCLFLETMGYVPERFTCDDCLDAPQCVLAFDGYNTGGDCLMDK